MTDVAATEPRSYYGRPVLKEPVWRWPIPAYFFTGGVAAGTSLLAAGGRLTGDDRLARRCLVASLAATVASTGLLIEDLGRPSRFANMLRVAKPTSPMSVGSWVLTAFGSATALAVVGDLVGVLPRASGLAHAVAATLAPVLATYTAVLVADTAIPAWHEAHRELPFVFAGSALAASGGLAALLSPHSAAARRVAVAGAAVELVATELMKRRLGPLAEPYRRGSARRWGIGSMTCTALGAVGFAMSGRRRRAQSGLSSVLLLAGSAATRVAVFRAGVDSARDPAYTVGPQRDRLPA